MNYKKLVLLVSIYVLESTLSAGLGQEHTFEEKLVEFNKHAVLKKKSFTSLGRQKYALKNLCKRLHQDVQDLFNILPQHKEIAFVKKIMHECLSQLQSYENFLKELPIRHASSSQEALTEKQQHIDQLIQTLQGAFTLVHYLMRQEKSQPQELPLVKGRDEQTEFMQMDHGDQHMNEGHLFRMLPFNTAEEIRTLPDRQREEIPMGLEEIIVEDNDREGYQEEPNRFKKSIKMDLNSLKKLIRELQSDEQLTTPQPSFTEKITQIIESLEKVSAGGNQRQVNNLVRQMRTMTQGSNRSLEPDKMIDLLQEVASLVEGIGAQPTSQPTSTQEQQRPAPWVSTAKSIIMGVVVVLVIMNYLQSIFAPQS